MKGDTDGEGGRKGIETTKQDPASRMQTQDPSLWDACGQKEDETPQRRPEPPGKAFPNAPCPQSHWLEGFPTLPA
jgi:hypothetical protein